MITRDREQVTGTLLQGGIETEVEVGGDSRQVPGITEEAASEEDS